MKYLITESQNLRMQILRRITSADWILIVDIVEEGLDLDDPCDFRDEATYIKRILNDSARTYLFHYYDMEESNEYKILFKYISRLIYVRLGDEIREYYDEKKEDCEDF